MFMNFISIALLTLNTISVSDSLSPSISIYVESEDALVISTTIQAIQERLVNTGYMAKINGDSTANNFRLQCDWDPKSKTDSTLLHNQLSNNEFHIELTLRQDDKIIRSLYQDMGPVKGLIIPATYDPTAIFVSRDPELLDEQKDALFEMINNLPESKYQSLNFVWSTRAQQVKLPNTKSFPAHILYAYNMDQSYNLTEADIQSAEVKRRPYGDDVVIKFKEKSRSTWEDLTSDAANDDARPAIMILNNEVYYSHTVRLVNDPCIISGNLNRSEASRIADKIRIGRLPANILVQ